MGLLYKEVSVRERITPIPIGVEFYKQMVSEGYTDITKYGICFYKKECLVVKGQ